MSDIRAYASKILGSGGGKAVDIATDTIEPAVLGAAVGYFAGKRTGGLTVGNVPLDAVAGLAAVGIGHFVKGMPSLVHKAGSAMLAVAGYRQGISYATTGKFAGEMGAESDTYHVGVDPIVAAAAGL